MKEADLLFEHKDRPEDLIEACERYRKLLLINENDYEACWKYSRAVSYIGEYYTTLKWENMYKYPLYFAKKATILEPSKPEGHLWYGILLGRYGQEKGIMNSLKNLKPMKMSLEKSIELDEKLEGGLAYRVLGRLYYTLPKILGGDLQKSLDYLNLSFRISTHPVALYYIAETYQALGDNKNAVDKLQQLMNMPLTGNLEIETKYYQSKAKMKNKQYTD